jgi:hypothetical protein
VSTSGHASNPKKHTQTTGIVFCFERSESFLRLDSATFSRLTCTCFLLIPYFIDGLVRARKYVQPRNKHNTPASAIFIEGLRALCATARSVESTRAFKAALFYKMAFAVRGHCKNRSGHAPCWHPHHSQQSLWPPRLYWLALHHLAVQ